MRIENIRFDGFKCPKRHASVQLSEKNITVIYGANGGGKTTLLKAINAFLSQDDASLLSLGIHSITCRASKDFEVKDIVVNATDEGYDWTAFEKSFLHQSRSLMLGVERGVSTEHWKIQPEALFQFVMTAESFREIFDARVKVRPTKKNLIDMVDELSSITQKRNTAEFIERKSEMSLDKDHLYLKNIKIENIEGLLLQKYKAARLTATRKIQSALFDTLSAAIDIEQSDPTDEGLHDNSDYTARLVENKALIIDALEDGEENTFKTKIVNTLRTIDQPGVIEKALENKILRQLFRHMLEGLEAENLVLSAINQLVDRFNAYLVEGKKLIVSESDIYMDIQGDRHGVNDLSCGERNLLTFLVLVLFEGDKRDFLIVDEPETSLHVKWQRELMSIFATLMPNTQVIVGSHSPALAQRTPDFHAELNVWRE